MTTKWHWEIRWLKRSWLHPNGAMTRRVFDRQIPYGVMEVKAREVNGRLIKVTVTEEVVCGSDQPSCVVR